MGAGQKSPLSYLCITGRFMSGKRAKHLRAAAKLTQVPGKTNSAKKALPLGVPVLLVAGIAAGYFIFFRDKPAEPNRPYTYPPLTYTQKVKSLDDLLNMKPERLADVDVAEMNLLCATGLPGAEQLDIAKCLAKLDEWAVRVKAETDRHLYRAHDPKWADHYKHSENWLRAEFLAQVLEASTTTWSASATSTSPGPGTCSSTA